MSSLRRIENLKDYLALFDAAVHDRLSEQLLKPGVDGLVVFENQDFTSAQFGARASLPFGPACAALKSPADAEGRHLNDRPPQRQYPTAYYEKPRLPAPEPV